MLAVCRLRASQASREGLLASPAAVDVSTTSLRLSQLVLTDVQHHLDSLALLGASLLPASQAPLVASFLLVSLARRVASLLQDLTRLRDDKHDYTRATTNFMRFTGLDLKGGTLGVRRISKTEDLGFAETCTIA